jgi:hypothetical protein
MGYCNLLGYEDETEAGAALIADSKECEILGVSVRPDRRISKLNVANHRKKGYRDSKYAQEMEYWLCFRTQAHNAIPLLSF